MIDWQNYEEYMMMHADGELQPAEEQELMAFIASHPELKSELDAYGLLRLTPDEGLVYTAKESLLKPLPQKRVVAFPQWGRYSIAAGIATLLIVLFFKYQQPAGNTGEMVKTDTVKPPMKIPVDDAVIKPAVAAMIKDTAKQASSIISAPVGTRYAGMARAPRTVKSVVPTADSVIFNVGASVAKTHEHISRISPVALREFSGTDIIPVTVAAVAAPDYEASADDNDADRSLLARMPINELKKKELEHIGNTIVNAQGRLGEIKRSILEKSVTIKVEKRKLILSF